MAQRVKPLKLTQREHEICLGLVSGKLNYQALPTAGGTQKVWSNLVAKLQGALEEPEPGIAAGPMEQIIMSHARGRVAKMVTGAAYSRASQLLTKLEATEQDMVDLGQWLAKQGWMTGTMTLVAVLGKYDEWLPRARAEKVTKAPPGFEDDGGYAGQGSTEQRNPAGTRLGPTL